jgi:hypothetical protein
MENVLSNDKKQIFKEVISLAENWREAHDSSGFEGGSIREFHAFQDTPAGKRIVALERELDEHLNSLDFEDVKMLQAVMYLGRDRDYDKSLPPNAIYKNELDYFNRQGWASKEIEIGQMTEKMPLADYLKSGLKILKVSI